MLARADAATDAVAAAAAAAALRPVFWPASCADAESATLLATGSGSATFGTGSAAKLLYNQHNSSNNLNILQLRCFLSK